MRRHFRGVAVLGVAALVAGSVATAAAASASPSSATSKVIARATSILHSCAIPQAHHAGCLSQLHVLRLELGDGTTRPAAGTSTSSGYVPADLHSAYKLPTTAAALTNGAVPTVAIVDAMDDPTAQHDLDVYRSAYGLSACDAGCFTKYNESGQTSGYPAVDTGWAQEESLDVDMVSAICQNCHVALVEASSTSDSDLSAAVDTAAKLPNVVAISNSYGGGESSSETSLNPAYSHAGIAVTASAGDSGYGVEFPAAAPGVTAVGGTTLSKASNARGWTETVWGSGGSLLGSAEGTGSGCSSYEPKPSWQKDAGCTKRTVADVAADADPNTGVAVYDSTADSSGDVGWLQFGGTSVASPIIASVYALAGNAPTIQTGSQIGAAYAYAHTSSLYDVTSGSNGSCGGLLSGGSAKKYLCTGEVGYDGPTGDGTPNGTGAF